MSESPSFSERRRRFREERGLPVDDAPALKYKSLAPKKTADEPDVADEFVPDVFERTESDIALDTTLNSINVLEAYNKWVGKEVDASTLDRREGIMVSCPLPTHRDAHPSAWLNIDKGTWFCGGCQVGGDIYDIAAYHKGYPVPGYKEGTTFHRLREEMAADFGTHIKRGANFTEVVWHDPDSKGAEVNAAEPETEDENTDNVEISNSERPAETPITTDTYKQEKQDLKEGETSSVDPSLDDDEPSNVVTMPNSKDFEEEFNPERFATLDWKSIVPEDTFLYEYLKATTVDDVAEEYHFWHGMMLLGHVVGHRVQLFDEPNVKANILLCILGPTASGKSRSRRYMSDMIERVMPFDASAGLFTTGVKQVNNPGSGEYLIRAFAHEYQDPTNPKAPPIPAAVNGVVDFDEMYTLMKKVRGQNSTLRPAIMELADSKKRVAVGNLTHGLATAIDPFCSIIVSTQPRAVREIISQDDVNSGFMNRWVFASGRGKQRAARPNFKIYLERAEEMLKDIKAWAQTEREVDFTPDGGRAFDRLFKEYINPTVQEDDTLMLKRLDLYAKKLMLLFAINNKQDTITPDIVKAVEPILHYMQECHSIVHGEIGGGKEWELNQLIEKACSRHWREFKKGASPRDIQRYIQKHKYSVEHIKRSLDAMVAVDILEVDKPKKQVGRPTLRYKVVGE